MLHQFDVRGTNIGCRCSIMHPSMKDGSSFHVKTNDFQTVPFFHRMGRFPPVVRTAVPVDGRFEHIVLSCNATSDHAIIWIEREARRALNVRFSFTLLSLWLSPFLQKRNSIYMRT